MKKIILLLLIAFSFLHSIEIDEYKVDLYYANGIMMQDDKNKAEKIWKKRVAKLLSSNPQIFKRIGKMDVAYNISKGMAADLFESFIQKTNLEPGYSIGWSAFKEFIGRTPYIGNGISVLTEVAEYATEMIHDGTLNTQKTNYKESIKKGHGVVVVAHSQGNLFTQEAYRDLVAESKDGWMGNYFHVISAATPGSEIPNGGHGVIFDNDFITTVPGGMTSNIITNPNRRDVYVYNALGELIGTDKNVKSIQYHGFEYYMGYYVYEKMISTRPGDSIDHVRSTKVKTNKAKTLIMGWVLDEINNHVSDIRASQWKIKKELGCLCKEKYIKMTHEHDPALMDIRLEDEKVKDFTRAGGGKGKIYQVDKQYVRASLGGTKIEEITEDNSDLCYVLTNEDVQTVGEVRGSAEVPKTKDGVVEIKLTWSNSELDYDLIVEWDAGEVDVKDTGCAMEHFHIKSDKKIYPGIYRVSIVPKNGSDEIFKSEDLYPFTIDLVTRTPGAKDKMHFVVKNQSDITLGHVSDIKVFRVDENGNEDNETNDSNTDDDTPRPFLIVPDVAPECPEVQLTPSPVPPRPVYFSRRGSSKWSYHDPDGGSSSGGSSGGGGTSFTVQQDPGCAGDVDCLPTPGDGSNGTGNPDDSINPYGPLLPVTGGQPVRDLEKKDNCTGNESCGCIPCEYEIIPYLRQIYFGPLRDANFSIYTLDGYISKESLFNGKTTNGKTLYDAGEIEVPQVFLNSLEDDTLYIIEAQGGEDIDSNDDFVVDVTPTKNLGKVYAIASGKDIKYTGFKVNILTTVTFELLQQSIKDGDTQKVLEKKIDQIASRLLRYKVYPNQTDSNITNVDLLAWLPTVDQDLLLRSYVPLKEMVVKTYAGENIYNEAYEYVFYQDGNVSSGELPLNESVLAEDETPVIKTLVANIDENATGGTVVGKIEVLRGSSDIRFGELSGKGSEVFEVSNEGEVKLRADSTLDYETKWLYKLKVEAFNKNGSSGLVAVYISVHNVLDAPEYIKFEGGLVDEDITGGTKVGQLFFDEGASPITEIRMNGTSTDLFTIDNNGTIRLAEGATLDYEDKYSYGFVVVAKNSYGSSMPVILYINIRDIADTPQITNYTGGYVHEDAVAGTFVGQVEFNGSGSVIENIYLSGEGSENFTVDMNGTLRVSDTAALDHETYALYQPTVTVTNAYGSATRRIFVSVVDAKDVPSFTSFSGGNVRENSAVDTVVGQVIFDPGSMPIDSIVMSGEGSELFKVLENGTIIVLDDLLNYEEKSHYILKVTASNALGSSAEVTVHLFVDDVFEQAVVLEDFVVNSVEENLPSGTVVGQVVILDTGSSPLEFFELSGEGAEKFSVGTEGNVTIERILDFEQQEVYNLQVKAKNSAGFGNEVNFIVRLSNIAEYVPVLYAFKGFVEDNASAGTLIGNVEFAVKGDTPISMHLEGEGKENFTIDNSGAIRVSSEADLDETVQKVYALSLLSSNEAGDGKSVEALIILTHDKTIPFKPGSLKLLDIGHNRLTLGWADNAQNERGFNLYIDGVKHITLNPDTTSYRVTGLKEDRSYIFTLKSFNDRGESQGLSIEGITDIDRSEYLKAVLGQKCGVSESAFDVNFNADTGHYNGYIYCHNKGLTDEDLLNFKVLKSVSGYLYLSYNNLTNVDGLGNLKSVGREFELYNNQLTNVDGLSKLVSVGSEFRLDNNQLTNVNGLSHLTSVGSHLYLQTNQLTNVNGLSSLISVGNNFNMEGNQLTNLDGLINFANLGGYLALRGNVNLTDISGISNAQSSNGQMLYVNPGQYTTKASESSNFCSTTWDLQDPNGNIADNMTQVCESGEPYTPLELDKFRDTLGEKCNISSSSFYSSFNADTGHYNGYIYCHNKGLTDEDLLNFKVLKSVSGYLYLSHNNLTNADGLSNLKSVGREFELYNNQLTNVDGLSKLISVGHEFRLDNNQLTNVNGLSALTSVGSHLYLQTNQLTNVNGLNALTSVGNNFNVEGNQLTNLDGLTNLANLGGYLALRGNVNLTDISGISNAQSSNGQMLYVNPGQYTTKASESSNFCSTTWDLQDPNGNIADDMTQVCESGEPYAPSELDKFRDTLGEKCNISSSTFSSSFNVDTGHYNGYIYCHNKGLTDEDLLNFKALKSVSGYLYLSHNNLTNVDGLGNLKSVGREFELYNNQLTNVDGLSKLVSVGSEFRLDNNQLTNVNGLSHLTSVGSHFYLQTNQLTNVNGLSALTRVGNNLNVEGNQLINLDGLTNLTSLEGGLALRGNDDLTDISGVCNAQSSNGKLLYINLNQYTTKASKGSNFCSTIWDLRDPSGNIADDMTQVCDMNSTELTPEDKLRNVLGQKCNISSSTFYSSFNVDTGHYNGYIYCHNKGLTDEDLLNFKALKSVSGYLYLSYNNLTNVDGLSNLKSVGREFELYNNQLTNVDGLIKLESVGGEFRLDNNKLSHVDGLSTLTSVGNNLNVEGNQLINLDGLMNLTSLGGDLALRGNADLTDISGVSNAQSSNGKLLYINLGQYSVKADDNGSFCSTTWDMKDPNGNVADDMTQVCDSVDPYIPTDIDNLRDVLGMCGIGSETFYSSFNADTGHYNGYIYCHAKGLTNEDLLNFKALKSVSGYLYLSHNQLTNLEGLSNLKSVGREFELYNNQLTNVDGLNKLVSVGSEFRLNNNKLSHVDGLSALTSVGSHLYLQTNQLTNVNGLSALTRVGNNLNVEGNQLINLDGLTNLTSLGGDLALRSNADLTDISGVSNIEGSNGQILYINQNQYEVKANENLKFCSTAWNMYDPSGDIADDLSFVCDAGAGLTDVQQLRAVMEKKCSVSFAQFANNFDENTGVYTGSVDCSHKKMNNDELTKFTLLNQITGSFSINDNNLTILDGLSNLTSIGGYFYLQNNKIEDISGLNGLISVDGNFDISNNSMLDVDMLSNLTTISGALKIYLNSNLSDIKGLSNIVGSDGKKIYIDTMEYSTKATLDSALCSAQWDIYSKTENIEDDMSKLCEGYHYVPTNTDRLRDILGKKCDIDSATFYSNFADDSGIYNGSIKCQGLTDEEMSDFEGLLEVYGDFRIEDSNITNLDGLIRVKGVTGSVSISNNQKLSDIYGLSNIAGVSNQELIIDDTGQYDVKADTTKDFCATNWDIYDGGSNVVNDMSKVCNE